MLVTLAFSLACNEDCWFQKKTRGAKDLCYCDVRPLTTLLARVLGIAPGVGYACLKHRRAHEKEDERFSSVLSRSHSENLMSIPRKLYQFHDERGKTVESYRPGGKWCNKCRAYYYRKIKTNKRVSLLACVNTSFFAGWWIWHVATVHCHQWFIRLKHN